MQNLRLALLVLFGCILLYVLHEHAQNGRYLATTDGNAIIDTRTGALYGAATTPNGPTPLINPPIK